MDYVVCGKKKKKQPEKTTRMFDSLQECQIFGFANILAGAPDEFVASQGCALMKAQKGTDRLTLSQFILLLSSNENFVFTKKNGFPFLSFFALAIFRAQR